MGSLSYKKYVFLIYAGLTLATIVAYAPLSHNEFVSYDDNLYVYENPNVRAGLTFESAGWAFSSLHGQTSYWHPLTWLSHMLDYTLFELNPLGHHITSLVLHIANTLLLFTVLRKMSSGFWQNAFVAATFALHPLHVESVAWVSERKDILSALFWILTMWTYLWYVKNPNKVIYLLALLAFAMGLMAKPMVVTLPFVLLLLDYWPLKRIRFAKWTSRNKPQSHNPENTIRQKAILSLVVEKIPFFALSVVLSVVTFMAQQKLGSIGTTEAFSISQRVANALVSYTSYIGKMIYPSRLAVLYPFPTNLPVWKPALSILTLAVLTVSIICLTRQKRYLAVGWLWFIGTLVPVIGLIQVGSQAMADRYTYLPSVGFFIMVAWGAAELTYKQPYRKFVLTAAAGLLLAAFSVCTHRQVGYWQNSATLYSHTLAVTQNNSVIHYNYGNVLRDNGLPADAIEEFLKALQIDPGYVHARINLGLSLAGQGKHEQAIEHYTEALRIKPESAEAHSNLGLVLKSQGKLQEAIGHFRQALDSEPDMVEVHVNLGNALKSQGNLTEAIGFYRRALELKGDYAKAHSNLGVALEALGKLDDAISHYREALRIEPDYISAHINIGNALILQGRLDDAIGHYDHVLQFEPYNPHAHLNMGRALTAKKKYPQAIDHFHAALRANPNWPQVYYYLGMVYFQQRRFEPAIENWTKVLKINPKFLDVLNNLAWILSTCEDTKLREPARAVELAQRACELTNYQYPVSLDVLAAAYASAGRFDDAVETAEKALNMAMATNQQRLADEIQKRLESYKIGRSWREVPIK